jgi:hypothetical protein
MVAASKHQQTIGMNYPCAIMKERGISTKGQRGYHILWYLSQTGLICLGPMQDKQQTFVLLDEWVPHSRLFSREESLAQLALR